MIALETVHFCLNGVIFDFTDGAVIVPIATGVLLGCQSAPQWILRLTYGLPSEGECVQSTLKISVDYTIGFLKFKIKQKTEISHCLMGRER